MKMQLLDLAEQVNATITNTEENVGSYCKKTTCWQAVQSMKYSLMSQMKNELKDAYDQKDKEKDAKSKQKSLNKINAQIEVFEKGLDYWTAMHSWAYENKFLTEKDLSILSTTLRMKTNPPSEKQSAIILNIEKRAIQEGFFLKNKILHFSFIELTLFDG